MLVLDKARALDRMVWLSQRRHNAVPAAFMRLAAPLGIVDEDGRRSLATAFVLRPNVSVAAVEREAGSLASRAA